MPTRTAATAAAEASFQAAVARVDWFAMGTRVAQLLGSIAIRELEAAGLSREDAIELAAAKAEEVIEASIRKHSRSRMLTRCADNIGTGARWVAADQLDRYVPQ